MDKCSSTSTKDLLIYTFCFLSQNYPTLGVRGYFFFWQGGEQETSLLKKKKKHFFSNMFYMSTIA